MSEPNVVEELEGMLVPLDKLYSDPENPNQHPMRSVEAMASAMEEHGQDQPIVARREDGRIIKGNGRYMAAQMLGWSEAAVLLVDDSEVEAIRRGLADHGAERQGFVRPEQMKDALREAGGEDRPVAGFTDEEISEMLNEVVNPRERGKKPEEKLGTFLEGEEKQIVLYFGWEEWQGMEGRLERAREEIGVTSNADLYRRIVDAYESD